MAEIKKNFLDLAGLGVFKTESEKVMDAKDAAVLEAAKGYADGLADNYDAAGTAATEVKKLADGQVATNKAAIEKLNASDATEGSVDYKIKAAVEEVNGAATTLGNRVTANETAIAAINNETTGILAQAKADATAKANAAQTAAEGKVTELANGAVAANTAAIEKLNGADTVDGSVKKQIKDAIDAVNGEAETLAGRVTANEEAIEAINDSATGIAKVAADALAAAKTELEGKITEEATTARAAEKANKDAITKLNGDENTDGSVAKSVKDAINDFAVKVSDDSTVNTFKELVDWAASHSSDAADMVAAIGENESAITALEELVGALPDDTTAETVVAYIDAVVKAEEDRAAGIEGGLETRLAAVEAKFTGEGSVAKQIEDAVKVEKDRAEAAESALDGKISGHETRIVALENVSIDAISEADIKALFTPAVTE